MAAKKIAYTHITLNSFCSACKLSAHFLSKKNIYIITDHRTQSLLCSSTKGSSILNNEGKTKTHSPDRLSRTRGGGVRGW